MIESPVFKYMNIERWHRLMQAFGFPPNDETFFKLQARYAEKHRHYHTSEHIDACLYHLDRCKDQADAPAEIELALWFHDAIYKPLSSGNERASADLARYFLRANKADDALIDRIDRLVMVTEHNVPKQTRDESLLVDIDLAILGAPPEIYQAFEDNVRKEYSKLPSPVFRRGRAKVLRSFLIRKHIFVNEPFRSERETQARKNLAGAINRLGLPMLPSLGELKSGSMRFLRAVLLGGPLLVAGLFGLFLLVIRVQQPDPNWLAMAGIGVLSSASLLAALWATGFWGRWGMLLFFLLLPILVLADFLIDPFFPAGVIAFAWFCFEISHPRVLSGADDR